MDLCVEKLSGREWDIIGAIAYGMSNREIAEKSGHTVKHVGYILHKIKKILAGIIDYQK